jgi:hypothetical protein
MHSSLSWRSSWCTHHSVDVLPDAFITQLTFFLMHSSLSWSSSWCTHQSLDVLPDALITHLTFFLMHSSLSWRSSWCTKFKCCQQTRHAFSPKPVHTSHVQSLSSLEILQSRLHYFGPRLTCLWRWHERAVITHVISLAVYVITLRRLQAFITVIKELMPALPIATCKAISHPLQPTLRFGSVPFTPDYVNCIVFREGFTHSGFTICAFDFYQWSFSENINCVNNSRSEKIHYHQKPNRFLLSSYQRCCRGRRRRRRSGHSF